MSKNQSGQFIVRDFRYPMQILDVDNNFSFLKREKFFVKWKKPTSVKIDQNFKFLELQMS